MSIEGYLSVDNMAAADKAYLIEAMLEFISAYQGYLDGDFPEFISPEFQEAVKEMSEMVNGILDKNIISFDKGPLDTTLQ